MFKTNLILEEKLLSNVTYGSLDFHLGEDVLVFDDLIDFFWYSLRHNSDLFKMDLLEYILDHSIAFTIDINTSYKYNKIPSWSEGLDDDVEILEYITFELRVRDEQYSPLLKLKFS